MQFFDPTNDYLPDEMGSFIAHFETESVNEYINRTLIPTSGCSLTSSNTSSSSSSMSTCSTSSGGSLSSRSYNGGKLIKEFPIECLRVYMPNGYTWTRGFNMDVKFTVLENGFVFAQLIEDNYDLEVQWNEKLTKPPLLTTFTDMSIAYGVGINSSPKYIGPFQQEVINGYGDSFKVEATLSEVSLDEEVIEQLEVIYTVENL